MPIQVDVERRRADVAEATLRVAAREGLGGVTVRAVAGELGTSTTAITNYLPTRVELLANAIDHLSRVWLAELESVLAERSGEDALREMMRTAVTWDHEELIRCQFWVAMLGSPQWGSDVDRRMTETDAMVRGLFEKTAAECGVRNPAAVADTLFLFSEGVFAAIVEVPSEWPVARLHEAADRLVDAVLA
jgi:AcrR family transcriptional regulator